MRVVPRPTLRVGITGHRLDKLTDGDVAALRGALAGVFAAIEAAAIRLGPDDGAPEMPRCRLVSALAEGTDRIAVDAAPRHWPLHALLPMPRDVYRADFLGEGQASSASAEAFEAYLRRAESVTELPMAAPAERDFADPEVRIPQYAALGHALVRQVDLLVAVWDGRPASGPGGTAAVVAEAVGRGLPVLWLDPTGREPPRHVDGFAGPDVAGPRVTPLDDRVLDAILAERT